MGSPFLKTSAPASCVSHSIGAPTASKIRWAATTHSGPIPSPGISVTGMVVFGVRSGSLGNLLDVGRHATHRSRSDRGLSDSMGAPCVPARFPRLLALAMVAVAMLATAPSPEHHPVALAAEQPAPEIDPALGIFNLDHVIFVVQENRSFDHYFGTFPGADGIPQHVCLPDPKRHRCARPYHDTEHLRRGRPAQRARVADHDRQGADGRSDPCAPSDRERVQGQPREAGLPSGGAWAERDTRRDGVPHGG